LLEVAPKIGDHHALAHVAAVAEVAARDWHILSRVDAERVREVEARFGARGDGGRVVPVPLFDRDIHDIGSLARYAEIVAGVLGRVDAAS
jgi:hypothetical protein